MFTGILQECIAFIFRLEGIRGSTFLQDVFTTYKITRSHNSEEHNLNFHCHENLIYYIHFNLLTLLLLVLQLNLSFGLLTCYRGFLNSIHVTCRTHWMEGQTNTKPLLSHNNTEHKRQSCFSLECSELWFNWFEKHIALQVPGWIHYSR